MDDASRLTVSYGVFQEATAENTIQVYEQKRHQFKSIDEYVHWHNEIKPHLSLNIETLETPIQVFQSKQPPKEERTETSEPLVR